MRSPTKLRHVVLFGFKPEVSPARIDEVVARFRALQSLVPDVDDLESGVDVSPEGLSQGHTHCFVLTFSSTSARDAYLPHVSHQEFVTWVGPFVAKALVVDFWSS